MKSRSSRTLMSFDVTRPGKANSRWQPRTRHPDQRSQSACATQAFRDVRGPRRTSCVCSEHHRSNARRTPRPHTTRLEGDRGARQTAFVVLAVSRVTQPRTRRTIRVSSRLVQVGPGRTVQKRFGSACTGARRGERTAEPRCGWGSGWQAKSGRGVAREAGGIPCELARFAAVLPRWHAWCMAMAICSEYTPVRSARGRTVHALPFTSRTPSCGKARPRQGWRVSEEPFNCLDCMAKMVAAIRKRRVAAGAETAP